MLEFGIYAGDLRLRKTKKQIADVGEILSVVLTKLVGFV